MASLTGKTALVTGASRGIGRAIALRLASEGASVTIHYRRDEEAAHSVATEIGTTQLAKADLSSADEVRTMFSWFPGNSLDILINNAGVWGQTQLGSTSEETLDAMVDVNLKGIFRVTQHALPKLKDGASIVNISSTAARVGNKSGRSLYGATKAAVDALTRSWALELAPRKIRVNAVAPGYVETDMTSEFFSNRKIREDAVERSPFGRLGNADEIADVVLFLCSPAAGWITGQAINVSGGFVV
jgi:NAD(P)-dependent dehydrogenase (short-subunit alcohol dehydrogenase family)